MVRGELTLLPNSSNSTERSETPRISPAWTWALTAGISLYAFLATACMVLLGWNSIVYAAFPALAIAIWMEYLYLRYGKTGSHIGLLISGIGWLAIAVAFLLGGLERPQAIVRLRMLFSLVGFVAIFGGGIQAYLETRTLEIMKPFLEGTRLKTEKASSEPGVQEASGPVAAIMPANSSLPKE